MNPANNSRGFVYVATGARYIAEACVSAASLRAAMPAARVALVTDAPPRDAAPLFDTVLVCTDVQHRPIDKLLAWEAPFERCVFLDTDTHVSGDLSELFDLLDTHDLAAAPETLRGWHYTLPGVPAPFPEYNTGVIVFRRTPAVADFFRSWRADYEALLAARGFVSDQPSFRWTAFRSPVRIAALPSEYHFIALTPNYTMWNVRLIHGRGDLAALSRDLNAHLGPRAYVPGLGPVAGFAGRKLWLHQLVRLLVRGLRVAGGNFGAAAQAPTHWTQEERSLTAARAEAKPETPPQTPLP